MTRLFPVALLACALAAPAWAQPRPGNSADDPPAADPALPEPPPLPDEADLPSRPQDANPKDLPGDPTGVQPEDALPDGDPLGATPPGRPPSRRGAAPDGGLWDAFMEGWEEGVRESQGRSQGQPDPELSEDEAAALGLGFLCCCFTFLLGLVVVVVLVVKASQKKRPAPPAPSDGWGAPARPAAAPAPGPAAAWAPPAPTSAHLSVLALAMDARARAAVQAALRTAGAVSSPPGPAERALLVGALCRALLGVEASWRAFGYGEKPDLPDDRAAEASFRSAWEDFRARCRRPGARGGEVAVAVLVLCSRGPSLGVSRLDDPLQVRDALAHRAALAGEVLLGAELLWAPELDSEGLGGDDALRLFPEMQALRRGP